MSNNCEINELECVIDQLVNMRKNINTMLSKLKTLNKQQMKIKKPKIVSGFVKPVEVSKEMTKFLNIDPEQKVSRSYVNKKINEYIKQNDLQIESSKQNFIIDDTLSTIFRQEKGSQVHYFKMQTYLKHNYIKKVSIT